MNKVAFYLVKNPLTQLSKFILDFFSELGSMTVFTRLAFVAIFTPPYKRTITRIQMDQIGVGSLPIVALTGLFMGLVSALQSIVELRSIGATSYIGRPLGTTIVREMGPVLASMMVAARAGSAIAAELASMAIGEQIDALRAEGSDPIKKLVEPRLVACMIMVPVLTTLCDLIAFVGGWFIATRVVQVSSFFYWDSIMEVLTPAFIWGGLIKSLTFGFVIGMVACYSGMKAGSSSAGVGEATTRAVVTIAISILALDFLLTKIFIVTWW
ncbi:MAG: ABC transporter permease [Candidatus Omnitrophica bacterium]|nr:ABC transporter permease [Candidatus Omnitrophota bacterium]